jgi:AMP deaminase
VDKGVYGVSINNSVVLEGPPSFDEFFKGIIPFIFSPLNYFSIDYSRLIDITHEGPVKTYSYRRLKTLQLKYQLHEKLNRKDEKEAIKTYTKKDWHTVLKACFSPPSAPPFYFIIFFPSLSFFNQLILG